MDIPKEPRWEQAEIKTVDIYTDKRDGFYLEIGGTVLNAIGYKKVGDNIVLSSD